MPEQLGQSGATAPEWVKRAAERVLAQALLYQHRQANHALGMPV
jgi:hypothetical protein